MRKLQLLFITKIFLVIYFLCITNNVSAGPNDYNLCLKNQKLISDSTFEFEIWISWTGTNKQKFQFFQGGLDFNYDEVANGGTITGQFVPGSADKKLPPQQQQPNWNINQTSKQIRMMAAIGYPVNLAVATPPPPGFRLGKFRMKNTVAFKKGVQFKLKWNYGFGSGSTTQTKEGFYFNTDKTGKQILDKPPYPRHCPISPYPPKKSPAKTQAKK
jgi:hypothetical protein